MFRMCGVTLLRWVTTSFIRADIRKPNVRNSEASSNYYVIRDLRKIQVEVFRVMRPRSVSVVHHRFGGPCCLHLHPKDRSRMDLRNVGILPHDSTRCHNPEAIALNITYYATSDTERETAK